MATKNQTLHSECRGLHRSVSKTARTDTLKGKHVQSLSVRNDNLMGVIEDFQHNQSLLEEEWEQKCHSLTLQLTKKSKKCKLFKSEWELATNNLNQKKYDILESQNRVTQ